MLTGASAGIGEVLRVMPEIPRETVAAEVVDAVESVRRAVRLPKRAVVSRG